MISDTLFDAAAEMKEYVDAADDGGERGDYLYECIVELVRLMDEVRQLPGLDRPPSGVEEDDQATIKAMLVRLRLARADAGKIGFYGYID